MTRIRHSVAMCTCNGSRYLLQQLESIASQTLLPDELVVCDDVSTDNTAAIVDTFARAAPFEVKLVKNTKRLGPAHNFERAISLCRGDLIFLCDQDDVWSPLKIEGLSIALAKNPQAAYAFSDADMVGEQGELLGQTLWEAFGLQSGMEQFNGANQLRLLLRRNVITGASMAIRAGVRNLILPIGSGWMHDYWIVLLASAVSYGVPVAAPLFMYRQHSKQVCGCLPPSSQRGLAWRKKNFLVVCKRSLDTSGDECRKKFEQFSTCLERACSFSDPPCPPDRLALLKEKEVHLRRRAATRSSAGLFRIAAVLGEAWTGRYQRYSDSWYSVLRDL